MTDILRKLDLNEFSNAMALDMGLKVLALASSRGQHIAVQIDRLNHTVFLHVGDGLTADKHNWLRRKINVAKHFEESSLAVKHDLLNKHMSLDKTFALDKADYLAKGGAIPIVVKQVGMVGVVCVSGLSDEEDHQIIVDALA